MEITRKPSSLLALYYLHAKQVCCFDNAVFETHIYIYTVGNYGDNDAVLYGLTILKTRASGSIFDRAKIYPDDEG